MIHVVPLQDVSDHRLDTTCDCFPAVEFHSEILVLHNSYYNPEEWEAPVGWVQPWVVVEGVQND